MYYYKVIKRRHTQVCYTIKGTFFYNGIALSIVGEW